MDKSVDHTQESQEFQKILQELYKKIGSLENHIIQLILRIQRDIPLDRIERIENIFSSPLKIADKNLIDALLKFQEDLKIISISDFVQTLQEIKFIGKRLNSIEERLTKIETHGIIHNIELDFRSDGYQLVKKSINHDETEKICPPYMDEEAILAGINEFDKTVLKRYLGICGLEKTTYKKMAIEYQKSPVCLSGLVNRILYNIVKNKKSTEKLLKSLNDDHPLKKAIRAR